MTANTGLCVHSYISQTAQTIRTLILPVGKDRPSDVVIDLKRWISSHTVHVSIFIIWLVRNCSERANIYPSTHRRVMTTNYRCFGEAANEQPIKLMLRQKFGQPTRHFLQSLLATVSHRRSVLSASGGQSAKTRPLGGHM